MDVSSIGASMGAMAMGGPPPRPPKMEGDPADFAANLIEENDADGDGSLSIEEIGMPEEMFSEIDADGDGLLTSEEIESDVQAKQEEMAARFAAAPQPDLTALLGSAEEDETLSSLLSLINANQGTEAYRGQNATSMYQTGDYSQLSLVG